MASNWFHRIFQQLVGINPFDGDCLPSRIRVFKSGRPALPFPHPWNYKDPIRIFEAFYSEADGETGSGKHNRYLYAAGMPPVLLSRDPEVIRAIQSATGAKLGQFDRDTAPTAGIARATGGDSLLYANGEVWRRQKRLSAQPFSRSNLFQPEKFHGFEKTFRATIAKRLEILRARQKVSGEQRIQIELEPEIRVVMLEMLVNNFFGSSVSYDELRDRFVPALIYLIDHMIMDTVAPRSFALRRLITGENRVLSRCRDDMETLTDIALAGREKGLGLWNQFQSDASNDALRSNIRVFLSGAMEATSSFACWALSHLSRRPDIQDQIHEEVVGLDSYDPDNYASARTLNRVLEETLRLTPSLYFLPRKATVDTWIETSDKRRMFIPKGTTIRLDVWHANRCEEFWGKAISGYPALEFAPERWEVLAQKGKTARDMLHFGFGHGPRHCPGRYLGLLEVGLVVGAIVKLFRFSPSNEKTHARAGVSTKPGDGVLVNLELREQWRKQ